MLELMEVGWKWKKTALPLQRGCSLLPWSVSWSVGEELQNSRSSKQGLGFAKAPGGWMVVAFKYDMYISRHKNHH